MARPATHRAPQRDTVKRPALRSVRSDQPGERDRQHRYYLIHLRASTSRRGQPFSERTVGAYSDAVASLNRYLTETDFAGDFTDLGGRSAQ
jgi:hypothetical protein